MYTYIYIYICKIYPEYNEEDSERWCEAGSEKNTRKQKKCSIVSCRIVSYRIVSYRLPSTVSPLVSRASSCGPTLRRAGVGRNLRAIYHIRSSFFKKSNPNHKRKYRFSSKNRCSLYKTYCIMKIYLLTKNDIYVCGLGLTF